MARRLLAAVLVAAAASGCGPSSSTPDHKPSRPEPTDLRGVIAQSAAVTQRSGTARVAMRMRISGVPQSGEVRATGKGVIAFARRRAQLRFHMSLPQAAVSLDMTERMVGTMLYIRSPIYTAAAGRPWVGLDLQRAGEAQGLDLNAVLSANTGDPAQMLAYLEAASDSITSVGADVVRGVATTHYRAMLDLRKVAAAAPRSQRAALRRTEERVIRMIGRRSLPVDVWIDARGLVRREVVDIPMQLPTLATPIDMSMAIDLYGFGVPVHVTAPPAAQVRDITALAVRSQAQAG